MHCLCRIALNVVATASALLCIAMLALWVRSYWVGGNTQFDYRGQKCQAWISRGKIGIDNSSFVARETTIRPRELWL